jgi:predicted nuclease with TOPRIM domain
MNRLVAGFNRLESQKVQVIEKLESEKAQKEAQVQKLTEELESERAQKTAEVQKVMEENVRLRAMLDKKEAQLQAMSEQCKFMALNHHN